MKRYEKFNTECVETRSAEMQSLGMIIALIADEYNLDLDSSDYEERYKAQLEWLNQEV